MFTDNPRMLQVEFGLFYFAYRHHYPYGMDKVFFEQGIINAAAIAPSLLQISRKPKPKQEAGPIIVAEG